MRKLNQKKIHFSYETNKRTWEYYANYNYKRIEKLIELCDCYSISLDGTSSNYKKTISLIVRFKVGLKFIEKLIEIETFKKAENGEELCEWVIDTLKKYKFDLNKLTGLVTDGAAVMTGYASGLRGLLFEKLSSEYNIPEHNLFYMHCCCHRINLSIEQCINLSGMTTINFLVKFIQKNEVMTKLREYMKGQKLKYPPKPSQTRWNYYGSVIQYISDNHHVLIEYLKKHFFNEFNEFGKQEFKEKKNYFPIITESKFICDLKGISVLLKETNEIIKILQGEKVFIHEAIILIIKHIRNYSNINMILNNAMKFWVKEHFHTYII